MHLEYNIRKVAMLGGRGSGKTTYINYIENGTFVPQNKTTLGKVTHSINVTSLATTFEFVDMGLGSIPQLDNTFDIAFVWINSQNLETFRSAYDWLQILRENQRNIPVILCVSCCNNTMHPLVKNLLMQLINEHQITHIVEIDCKTKKNIFEPLNMAISLTPDEQPTNAFYADETVLEQLQNAYSITENRNKLMFNKLFCTM
jgi:GTPase SAR1 family protein